MKTRYLLMIIMCFFLVFGIVGYARTVQFVDGTKHKEHFNVYEDASNKTLNIEFSDDHSIITSRIIPFYIKNGQKRYVNVDLINNFIWDYDKKTDTYVKFGTNITLPKQIKNIDYIGFEFESDYAEKIDISNEFEIEIQGDGGAVYIDFSDIAENVTINNETNEVLVDVSTLSDTIYIDPTVQFTTEAPESVDVLVIDNNKIVVGWCDEANDDIEIKGYYTNGSVLFNQYTVDSSVTYCNGYGHQIGMTALNETQFAIAWGDNDADNIYYSIFNEDGTPIREGMVIYNYYSGYIYDDVELTTLTSSLIGASYKSTNQQDIELRFFNTDGTNATNAIDVDTVVASDGYSDITAMSDSLVMIHWYDGYSNNQMLAVYDTSGSKQCGDTTVNSRTDSGDESRISSFNSTQSVLVYYDDFDDDISYEIFTVGCGQIKDETDVDQSAGSLSGGYKPTADVGVISDNTFVVVWFKEDDQSTNYAVIQNDGTYIKNPTQLDTTTEMYEAVTYNNTHTGIALCNNSFVIAYVESTNSGKWIAYNPKGESWDGECPAPPVADDTSFQISMPDNYASYTDISGTDEAGASSVSSILFNATSGAVNMLQPHIEGNPSAAQTSELAPIYRIDPSGNVNMDFSIRGTTNVSGVLFMVNATCEGTCTSQAENPTAFDTGYIGFATSVATTGFVNVTLYANISMSAGVHTGASNSSSIFIWGSKT